jgi:hypothetical protein
MPINTVIQTKTETRLRTEVFNYSMDNGDSMWG